MVTRQKLNDYITNALLIINSVGYVIILILSLFNKMSELVFVCDVCISLTLLLLLVHTILPMVKADGV